MKGFGIYNYALNMRLCCITHCRFEIAADNELIDTEDSKNHLRNFFYTRYQRIIRGDYYVAPNLNYDSDELAVAFGILGGLKISSLVKRFGANKVENVFGKPLDPIKTMENKMRDALRKERRVSL